MIKNHCVSNDSGLNKMFWYFIVISRHFNLICEIPTLFQHLVEYPGSYVLL